MQRQDVIDTSISILIRLDKLINTETGNIDDLYEEYADKNTHEILFHTLGIIAFIEHAASTDAQLNSTYPHLRQEILAAKASLQNLLTQHLLMTVAKTEATIARLESKIDALTELNQQLSTQVNSTLKSRAKVRWGHQSAPTNVDTDEVNHTKKNLCTSLFGRKR